jgi:hypothetical protein
MTPANHTVARPAFLTKYGRLRWNCVRRYIGLDRDTWFRIAGEEADGLWIEGDGIGDPMENPNRRFVFREDFELRVDTVGKSEG